MFSLKLANERGKGRIVARWDKVELGAVDMRNACECHKFMADGILKAEHEMR